VAKEMLRMADVQPGAKMVDLGAGDGRIVIAAARLPGVQAVGVEIDPLRCLVANGLIALHGLRGRARVHWGNMFDFDLSDADVVTLYLWRSTNRRLAPSLVERLRPGAKVISHHFPVANWIPLAVDPRERIYAYEIGNTGLDIRAMLTQGE
jgi:SAM-dependent methyltransferase